MIKKNKSLSCLWKKTPNFPQIRLPIVEIILLKRKNKKVKEQRYLNTAFISRLCLVLKLQVTTCDAKSDNHFILATVIKEQKSKLSRKLKIAAGEWSEAGDRGTMEVGGEHDLLVASSRKHQPNDTHVLRQKPRGNY